MKPRDKMYSLYLFYGVYFVAMGLSTFAPKYYGAIGLNNSQIGLISAAAAFFAIFAQPVWGVVADRTVYKKYVVAVSLFAAGLCAFAAEWCGSRFLPLLIMLTLLNTFTLPAIPVGSSISLEYAAARGKGYGPIRMTGTIGYQLGILVIGFVLSESLRGLYVSFGIVLMLAGAAATLMPSVRGHQHGTAKVPLTVFFKNRRVMIMLALAFLTQVCTQFYLAFFSKYLGDIGMSNELTGFIAIFSVILEIPFLMVGDKLYSKLSIWKWLWLGLFFTGVRFVWLSYAASPLTIILAQLLSVAVLACYEFFPAVYLSRAVDKELSASAQNVYQTVSYGVSRVVGALFGGMLAQAFGIVSVFRAGGWLLMLAALATFVPLCMRMRDET